MPRDQTRPQHERLPLRGVAAQLRLRAPRDPAAIGGEIPQLIPTEEVEAILGRKLATPEQFVADVRGAITEGRALAVGKHGRSELGFLQYPVFLDRVEDETRRHVYEMTLAHRNLRAAGVFPVDPASLRAWSEAYAGHSRALDYIGIDFATAAMQAEVSRFHGLEGEMIRSRWQQPDRSFPADEERCWLPALEGKRVLVVGAFAELIAERADQETFEAVWANIGKPWFHPASVEALVTPYGWMPETQERYGTSLALLDELCEEIARRDFDVALIAAGGIGDGIAAAVARMGRVGISVGGHLQMLFGVLGERWRKESWERYRNDAWIDMPPELKPDFSQTTENYW